MEKSFGGSSEMLSSYGLEKKENNFVNERSNSNVNDKQLLSNSALEDDLDTYVGSENTSNRLKERISASTQQSSSNQQTFKKIPTSNKANERRTSQYSGPASDNKNLLDELVLNSMPSKEKARKDLTRSTWTIGEDKLILEMQSKIGNKWAKIARLLHDRDASQVKIRFRSLMRAKKWEWSEEDDKKLIELRRKYKSDWDTIAEHLDGRTKHAARTRYKEIMNKRERELIEGSASPKVGSLSPDTSEISSAAYSQNDAEQTSVSSRAPSLSSATLSSSFGTQQHRYLGQNSQSSIVQVESSLPFGSQLNANYNSGTQRSDSDIPIRKSVHIQDTSKQSNKRKRQRIEQKQENLQNNPDSSQDRIFLNKMYMSIPSDSNQFRSVSNITYNIPFDQSSKNQTSQSNDLDAEELNILKELLR